MSNIVVFNNTRYNKYRLIDGTRFIAISTTEAMRYSKKVGVKLDMEDAYIRYSSWMSRRKKVRDIVEYGNLK
jgi:hypothetical protein